MYTCRFLSDEDDGVSEAIIPFAVQYIGLLKVYTCTQFVSNSTWSLTYILCHVPGFFDPLCKISDLAR